MRMLEGIVLLVLAHGVAGCSGPSLSCTHTFYNVMLSGVVSERTSTGQVPLEGVGIYCEACGEFGHTSSYTDARGFYSFTGAWLTAPVSPLSPLVAKEGYTLPPEVPSLGAGRIHVTSDGDTRFDIQLVRR